MEREPGLIADMAADSKAQDPSVWGTAKSIQEEQMRSLEDAGPCDLYVGRICTTPRTNCVTACPSSEKALNMDPTLRSFRVCPDCHCNKCRCEGGKGHEDKHAVVVWVNDSAFDLLANFPANLQWLSPTEKKAFATRIIGFEDIITHARCHGSGRVDSSINPDDPYCDCPQGSGKIISDAAKARICEAYPHYQFEPQE